MSPVKPKRAVIRPPRGLFVLMDRAEERAGAEDVSEQALVRGLDTAFPFFVWGCPGLASGVDQAIGHIMGYQATSAGASLCLQEISCLGRLASAMRDRY